MSIPSYIRWATSPSAACCSWWQWSIQMPGLSATNATSKDSPLPTVSESNHHGLPVAGTPLRAEHDGVVAVQVHRVQLAAGVGEVHGDDVALAHHEHRHVRVLVTVDRPPQPRQAVEEAEAAPDRVLEPAVGRGRVEPERGGRAVGQQVDGGRRARGRRRRRAEHDGRVAADLDAHAAPCGGATHLQVGPSTRGDLDGRVAQRGGPVHLAAVDGDAAGTPRPVGHTRIGPLSVFTTRTRTGVPGAAVTGTSPARPLTVRWPS